MKKNPLLVMSLMLFVFSITLAMSNVMATTKHISSNNHNNSKQNNHNLNDNNRAKKSILLLGDSLSASYGMDESQGWVALLNKRLHKNNQPYNIVNASISGETTTGGLMRLPAILSKKLITDLIIELGGNDGLRGYSPQKIENNLLQIIELAQAKNIKVYLMQIKIPPNYGIRYNQMFEQVFENVAKEKNIPMLPFFMEQIANDKTLMQKDGIHPNKNAQHMIADIMAEQLQQIIN